MIKLLKYLKRSAGYVVLIVLLLFLQAYCDLSLPDYTSKIVNVGIQQQGIEDGVPEKIRTATMDSLRLFMDGDAVSDTEEAYTQEDDLYILKDDIDEETREQLNERLRKTNVDSFRSFQRQPGVQGNDGSDGNSGGKQSCGGYCPDAGRSTGEDDFRNGRKNSRKCRTLLSHSPRWLLCGRNTRLLGRM